MITAVITAHRAERELSAMMDWFIVQPFQDVEKIVLVSDMAVRDYPNFYRCPNRDDWGHEKRSLGLFLAKGDYVAFFNTDDEYEDTYLTEMVAATEDGTDLVYCDFYSHLFGGIRKSEPRMQAITSGNFLVKRELAQRVGYNHRVYEADGLFIEDIMKAGATHKRVPEVLYTHL